MTDTGQSRSNRPGLVRGLSFLGIRTDKLPEMRTFLVDTLGLVIRHERQGFVACAAPDGSRIELFALDYPGHQHFTTGPVGGFEVSDIGAAWQLAADSNCKFLSDIQGRPEGTRWFHFRGPDGNVYEMVHHPDIAESQGEEGE